MSEPHRTQEDRRRATRAAVVSAAVQCLLERGYSATSVGEVQKRARVARGTVQYHFPTRAELMAASVAHVVELRMARTAAASQSIPPGEDRLWAVVDMIWDDLTSPDFYATLELWVAGRTDPDLGRVLLREQPRLLAMVEQRLAEAFSGSDVSIQEAALLARFTVQFLTGLSLTLMLPGAPDQRQMLEAWKRAIVVLHDGRVDLDSKPSKQQEVLP